MAKGYCQVPFEVGSASAGDLMVQRRQREYLAQADRRIAEAKVSIAVLKDRISLHQEWGYTPVQHQHTAPNHRHASRFIR